MKTYKITLESVKGLDTFTKQFVSYNEAWEYANYSYKSAIEQVIAIEIVA